LAKSGLATAVNYDREDTRIGQHVNLDLYLLFVPQFFCSLSHAFLLVSEI